MELAVLFAEQGNWLLATVIMGILWWMERRHRETAAKFRHMLEEHDGKNDEDFKEVRDRLHDISDRLARIEGALTAHRKDD